MLRMEIALLLVMGFIACVYFSAGRKGTPLHRTFSALLVVVLIHLSLDGVTVYTVHHLETVPRLFNDAVHSLESFDSKLLFKFLDKEYNDYANKTPIIIPLLPIYHLNKQ